MRYDLMEKNKLYSYDVYDIKQPTSLLIYDDIRIRKTRNNFFGD